MPTVNIPAHTSSHCEITGWDNNYNTARGTASDFSGPAGTGKIAGQARDNFFHFVYRYFFRFPVTTSHIPPGSTITRVRMRLVALVVNTTGGNSNIQITKADWSAYSPVVGNMQAIYTVGRTAALDAVWRSTSGMATNTQYISNDLDVSRVIPGQSTYYGLRSSMDANATPLGSPNTQSAVQVAKAGYDPNPAWAPTLIVDYDDAPPPATRGFQIHPVIGI